MGAADNKGRSGSRGRRKASAAETLAMWGSSSVNRAPAKGSRKGCMRGKGGPENSKFNYRGVRQKLNGKWVSEIRVPGGKKKLWLGTFQTAIQAATAYDDAAKRFYGSAARLNLPPGSTSTSSDTHPPANNYDDHDMMFDVQGLLQEYGIFGGQEEGSLPLEAPPSLPPGSIYDDILFNVQGLPEPLQPIPIVSGQEEGSLPLEAPPSLPPGSIYDDMLFNVQGLPEPLQPTPVASGQEEASLPLEAPPNLPPGSIYDDMLFYVQGLPEPLQPIPIVSGQEEGSLELPDMDPLGSGWTDEAWKAELEEMAVSWDI